jgi:hypothetical protein
MKFPQQVVEFQCNYPRGRVIEEAYNRWESLEAALRELQAVDGNFLNG